MTAPDPPRSEAGAVPRALAIVGPTASGKTELSLALARIVPLEVISMDSRQVYRGMDVGTAKATAEERAAVPHHGLDRIGPEESYSAARFAQEARGWIAEIEARAMLPLLVGGTGFFLRALTEPLFREPSLEPTRRDRLRQWMEGRSLEELLEAILLLDPDRMEVARVGGRQRVMRTLEVAWLTGRPLSQWHREGVVEAEPIPIAVVVLDPPAETLRARIDTRTEAIFQGGLLAEVEALVRQGIRPDDPGMTGVGYREALAVLRGESTLEEAVRAVRLGTWALARRQRTWFRTQVKEGPVLRIVGTESLEDRVQAILQWRASGWTEAGVRG
jgi:tRNA dimethylallyltransferase